MVGPQSNCGFDFLCCMLGGFELFITSVWVQLHAGQFSASWASRGSCTQFLCCTLGGFEIFITSVGVQLHAGRFLRIGYTPLLHMLAKCGLDQGRKVVRTTIVQLDFDGMVYV